MKITGLIVPFKITIDNFVVLDGKRRMAYTLPDRTECLQTFVSAHLHTLKMTFMLFVLSSISFAWCLRSTSRTHA